MVNLTTFKGTPKKAGIALISCLFPGLPFFGGVRFTSHNYPTVSNRWSFTSKVQPFKRSPLEVSCQPEDGSTDPRLAARRKIRPAEKLTDIGKSKEQLRPHNFSQNPKKGVPRSLPGHHLETLPQKNWGWNPTNLHQGTIPTLPANLCRPEINPCNKLGAEMVDRKLSRLKNPTAVARIRLKAPYWTRVCFGFVVFVNLGVKRKRSNKNHVSSSCSPPEKSKKLI